MNELKSYTEYAVSTPTADFVIGFDFNYGEDAVNVTVDDVPATTAGYTVVYLNEKTIRLSPSVPSGIVRLQRETDIDQTANTYRAGAKFIAQTMDENFKQIRHAQQEVNDHFSSLEGRTSARLDTFSDLADNLNNEFISTRDVVSDLVTISADTVTVANNALNTANAVDAKASTALSNSSTALSTATGIDGKASTALSNSSTALSTATGIDGKATNALDNSLRAVLNSSAALNTANAADSKATQALADSAAALTATSGTLKSSNNLSDVSSATVSRANLGVMSASEVTTAIANATSPASITNAGLIKIATQAEVDAGANGEKAIVPNTLGGGVRSLLNVSGSAPMYACRAWVNFSGVPLNGTYSQAGTTVTVTMTAHGMSVGQTVGLTITSGTAVSGSYTVATVANANTFTYTAGTNLTTSGNVTRNTFIRASGNVHSITDNGVGDYSLNFTSPMPDSNYCPNISIGTSGAAMTADIGVYAANAPTSWLFRFATRNSVTAALLDASYITVSIFK